MNLSDFLYRVRRAQAIKQIAKRRAVDKKRLAKRLVALHIAGTTNSARLAEP